MKRSTRVLIAVVIVILLLLVLLAVVPFFFRGRIAERAQAEVNQNVNARVGWSDVGLSFFRHFPNLSLSLDNLTAVGVGRFAGDTLTAVRRFQVVLGLGSVVRYAVSGGPLVIHAVELDAPRLRLVKLEDGAANWDIMKKNAAAAPSPSSKPLAVSLRRFEINNGTIEFDNRRSRFSASLIGYNQSVSGDFSQRRVVIQTRASADTASVVFAGIPYLDRVKLALATDVQADLAGKSYTLRHTELRLNDLVLDVAGSARSAGKLLGLDLAFKAPSTNFRSILSLVPAIYAHDFSKVQTAGSVALDGWVKGEYGDHAFPAFAMATTVNDAAFKYPDLPLPARSIFVHLALTNPGGSADSTVVKLDRFHMIIGSNPIDARLLLTTPLSDPNVDARLTGTLDLADVRRTVQLQGIEQLAGIITANATVRTRMSFVEKKEYDKVAASGTVDVKGVTVNGKALPHPLAIQQASLALAPQRAQLKTFAGTIGSSDLQASGTLDNLIAFALHGDTLHGTATARCSRFNLNEWRSGGELQIIPVPPKIDFTLDATMGELLYGTLTMTGARGHLRIADQRLTLDQFQTNTLGGQIAVSGYYETTHPDRPTFDVSVKMTNVDIPSAFQTFTTVQMLAPVAKYASGTVNTDVHLTGALGKNMIPLFPGLNGSGALETSPLALHDFPVLNKVANATTLPFLNNPTIQPLQATFRIQNGRLFVQPFDVKLAGVTMTVAGSNGLDQSLQYTLDLGVPRSMLGSGANRALAGLASQAAKAGLDLNTSPEIPLAIQVGGTVTSPSVKVDLSSVGASIANSAQQAVTQKVSAAGAQLIQQAEQRAASIRQDAQTVANKVKQEGYRQADSLTAKAGTNPLLQAAATAAADKLRQQADDKAASILRDANQRADSLVAAARAQARKTAPQP